MTRASMPKMWTRDFDTDYSDAQNNFNDAQDSFNNTAKAISTGWIVGIVIIAIAAIGSIATVILFLMRRKKRRAQYQEFNQMVNNPSNGYNAQNQHMNTYDSHYQPSAYHHQQPYNPWPEVQGSEAPRRFEAEDTGYSEAPDTQVTKSPAPTYTAGPRAELAGNGRMTK